LGIYYPSQEKHQMVVHSKIMVVDDHLLRVGSSNLTNRSMRVDTECDIAVESSGEKPVEAAISYFRCRLLGEHLGMEPKKCLEETHRTGALLEFIEGHRGLERSLEPLPHEETAWLNGLVPELETADPNEPFDIKAVLEDLVPKGIPRPQVYRVFNLFLVMLLLLGAAAAWRWSPLNELLTMENLRAAAVEIKEFHAAPLIVMGIYLMGSLVACPVTLLIAGTALTFGPFLGPLYSLLGSLLGATATYALGRLLGKDVVKRLAGSRVNRVSRKLAKHGVITVISIRLLPLAPFTFVNMIAGASHIRFKDFFFGTILGMTPGILAITVLERQLHAVISDPDLESFAVLAGVFLVIGFAVWGIHRWLKVED
jgi:uncharacterized membrane protein YdjX (TVP38/TMEM64 family)